MSSSIKKLLRPVVHKFLGQGGAAKLYEKRLFLISNLKAKMGSSSLGGKIVQLFTSDFKLEQKAMSQGIRVHMKKSNNLGQLRRNIHRIEKGLTMQPRRAVFGKDYIQDAVRLFSDLNDSIDESTRYWCLDVLTRYFEVVTDSSELIESARQAFKKLPVQSQEARDRMSVPFKRTGEPNVPFEEFKAFVHRRRSVRWFDAPMPVELIRKAVNVASQAPSACNRQPYEFVYVQQPELCLSVLKLAKGTGGFSENVPGVIVVVGDQSNFNMYHDRHLIYIDSSLASMQLMLTVESLGYASCPINWPEDDKANKKLNQLLDLPEYKRAIMLIAVGHESPTSEVPYSAKKPAEVLLREIL